MATKEVVVVIIRVVGYRNSTVIVVVMVVVGVLDMSLLLVI